MIFTESTIKISNNVSKMDSTIVLYRGDKNVEIRFTILQSPFKYSNTVATNVIESTNASYGQLVIKTPNDKPPIFSEVSATKEGTILFTITKEMIDEIEEVGVYTFQIRLMDENKQSRVTIPPVENGIEIKEPIAIEDDNTTNVVGLAKANYAVATSSDVDTPTFDDNGKYNKTNWNDGDIITNVSLNKIEDGIYTTNENVTATKKYVDDNTVIHPLPVHQIQENDKTILKIVDIMDLIEGVTYSTQKDINQTKSQGYRIVYICDDGTFRLICTLPLVNKVIHLLKVIHFTNYSTLSDNNITYKVDYTNHSTNTDIQITKTLQNYIPIANNIEYTPTREYHPATKKYADDKFICTDIVDNVGTISKEEMQKCNNGTSRYVSSIKFKEFFADYEHCIYQGTYGDKKIRMKYDKDYNRMIAYDLTDVIQLGFEFNNNYMYPFNAGTDEVKAYQFTNDLVITKSPVLNPSEVLTKNNTHEYTPTTDYNPATKKYVDDIKTGIDGIKADLGTAQLTTNAKDVKGAVNEVNAQYKDIVNDISNLLVLNGVDNFNIIQNAIDKGGHIRIRKKGVFITSPLTIGDNTTIELCEGATLKLKRNSHNYLLTNKDYVNGNKNIKIIGGGTWDNNKDEGNNGNGAYHEGQYPGFGLFFNNIENFYIEDYIGLNSFKYNICIVNSRNVIIKNLKFNTASDGIHFLPPCKNVLIDGVSGFTHDDMISFTIGDYKNYRVTYEGNFEDVTIQNINLNGTRSGIKLTGSGESHTNVFKNIKLQNIYGVSEQNPLRIVDDTTQIEENTSDLLNTRILNLEIENFTAYNVGKNSAIYISASGGGNIKINKVDFMADNFIICGENCNVDKIELNDVSNRLSNDTAYTVFRSEPGSSIKDLVINGYNVVKTTTNSSKNYGVIVDGSIDNIYMTNVNCISYADNVYITGLIQLNTGTITNIFINNILANYYTQLINVSRNTNLSINNGSLMNKQRGLYIAKNSKNVELFVNLTNVNGVLNFIDEGVGSKIRLNSDSIICESGTNKINNPKLGDIVKGNTTYDIYTGSIWKSLI